MGTMNSLLLVQDQSSEKRIASCYSPHFLIDVVREHQEPPM